MSENCRPEKVSVDGEDVQVLIRGDGPLDDAGRTALAEVVKASLNRASRTETVRQRAIGVLEEHRAVQGGCLCGSSATGRRHVVHVTNNLANAGVLRPLYDDSEPPPSPIPRVWRVIQLQNNPPEPEIGGEVRDHSGDLWDRTPEGWVHRGLVAPWSSLIARCGPLTEVIQDGSYPDGGADA